MFFAPVEHLVLRARGAFTVEIAPNGIASDSNSQVSLEAVLFPIVWDWMFSVPGTR